MMFYKFLHARDVDHVLRDGTVVLSNTRHFSRYEADRQEWIADRREGTATLTSPPKLTLTENSAELDSVNRSLSGLVGSQFIKVESGGSVEFGNVNINISIPLFIYSFSNGDLDSLTIAMCQDAPLRDRYDACLCIKDPHRLIDAIYAGTITDLDATTSSVLAALPGGAVTYGPVSIDVASGNHFYTAALRKAPEFADQREHRFIFEARRPGLPDRLIVRIEDPASHFELVFAAS